MTFTPTVTTAMQPSSCHVCGRQAQGIGVGNPSRGDPRFLCQECLLLLERVREIRNWTPYELKALDSGVDAVGEYIESIGGKTNLREFDELEQRMLVKAAWRGCGDGLHRILEAGDAPF